MTYLEIKVTSDLRKRAINNEPRPCVRADDLSCSSNRPRSMFDSLAAYATAHEFIIRRVRSRQVMPSSDRNGAHAKIDLGRRLVRVSQLNRLVTIYTLDLKRWWYTKTCFFFFKYPSFQRNILKKNC